MRNLLLKDKGNKTTIAIYTAVGIAGAIALAGFIISGGLYLTQTSTKKQSLQEWNQEHYTGL